MKKIFLTLIFLSISLLSFSQSKIYFDYWTIGEYDINGTGYFPWENDNGSYFEIQRETDNDGYYVIYWENADRYYDIESYRREENGSEFRIWGYNSKGYHIRMRMVSFDTYLDVYYDFLSGEVKGKSIAFRSKLKPNI